ncbi:MAG TPA: hypothetical protein VIV40_09035 [Kofleriaceae bacterium]
MTQALTTIDSNKRTAVTFAVRGDPWPVIAAWAQKHRYMPREPQTGNVKLFQKGSGFWTAAMRAQFTQRGEQIELQAWLPISIFARIAALFMLPAEMHIRSGGFRAVLPRKIARDSINDLLQQVGAPPIP